MPSQSLDGIDSPKSGDPLCRYCMIPLSTDAEARMGIHIACVQELAIRKKKYTIPRPQYGRVRSEEL